MIPQYNMFNCSAMGPKGQILAANVVISGRTQAGARDKFVRGLELPKKIDIEDVTVTVNEI